MRYNVLIISLFVSINAYTQKQIPLEDGKVLYRQVIELDTSYKAKGLFSVTKTWFSTNPKNFWRSNLEKQQSSMLLGVYKKNMSDVDLLYHTDTPLRLADQDENHCIGKSVIKYTGSKIGCCRLVYLEYDIDVQIKNGKVKVECSNFHYTHYNQATGKRVQIYGMSSVEFCKEIGILSDLLKCQRCDNELAKFYEYIDENVKAQLADFSEVIKKKQKDW